MTTDDSLGGTTPVAGGPRTIRRVGFGAMQLAGPGVLGPPADRAQAIALLRRVVELGINHIDTSDFYGPWVVNELIAEALAPYPDDLFIATKVGAYRDHHGGWLPLAHPEALKAQVHDNLRRLGVTELDLVYLRVVADDPSMPFADQVGALVQLREAGLVRGIGLSNVSLAQCEQARELTEIVAVQNLYNLIDRSAEDVLRATGEWGAMFVPFFPLGSGFQDSAARESATLREIADRHGVTQAQVSLAWLLRRAPHVVLIPGTSTPTHLEENSAVGRLALTDEEIAALDAAA